MALFCKKHFPSRASPLCFLNALRPDSPLPKFREQQNSSESSESTESTERTELTEGTEGTEDAESTEDSEETERTEPAEGTEAPVSEQREPVPANRPAPASDSHSCLR